MHGVRVLVASMAAVLAACPESPGFLPPVDATCTGACGAVFSCAGSFAYDLTDTLGTQSDCVAACESSPCAPQDAQKVTTCIASLTCPTAIDTWGASTLQCVSGNCSAALPLPVGACDTSASSGECVEYLGGDLESLDYGRNYCTAVTGGTWGSLCPPASRVASCLVLLDGSGSRGIYYTSTLDLAAKETLCHSNPYGGRWTTY